MSTFTKKAIKAAFLKLLNERPYNKITVKTVVEECGINRNSFYYHFEDLPALTEEIFKDEVDRILEEQSKMNSLEDCLCIAIDFIMQNQKAALNIFTSSNREYFERYLNDISSYVVTEYIDSTAADLEILEEDRRIIINYYKYELVGFVLDWMNSGMSYDVRKHIRRLCELFDGATRTAFLRSANVTEQEKNH